MHDNTLGKKSLVSGNLGIAPPYLIFFYLILILLRTSQTAICIDISIQLMIERRRIYIKPAMIREIYSIL